MELANPEQQAVQQVTAQVEAAPRDLFTVQQFAERRPAWSGSALRSLILNATSRVTARGERVPGNGLHEAGAIIRVGRRVLIDESAFFRWVAKQQRKAAAPRARPRARRTDI